MKRTVVAIAQKATVADSALASRRPEEFKGASYLNDMGAVAIFSRVPGRDRRSERKEP